MLISAMNNSLSAMNAFSTGVHGSAYNLAVNQNAFDANAQVIRASDEMLGTLVDMIV